MRSFSALLLLPVALLVVGCGSTHIVTSPLSGTATGSLSLELLAPDGTVTAVGSGHVDAFQLTAAGNDAPASPVGHDRVELFVATDSPSPLLGDATIGTEDTSFAAMTPEVRHPLSAISGLSIATATQSFETLRFDLSSAPGSFILHPTLAPDGTGTLVLELDMPPVTVTTTTSSGDRVTLRLSASLVCTQAFVAAKAEDYNKTDSTIPSS